MRGFGSTRPVGEPLPMFPRFSGAFAWPEGYRAAWLDTGTSALAVAVRALVLESGRNSPAIVLPAYTCPDVVSAVTWAGARPVLVDTQPGLPWLALSALQQFRDESWAGVIAPHFLGLRHPMGSLREWCREQGLGLIEDSAQLSPRSPVFRPVGEFVVLSFGRGKPIPAGGGVLLFCRERETRVREITEALPEQGGSTLTWKIRALMHNFAITRPVYHFAKSIPWLNVGKTLYKPLSQPMRLDANRSHLGEAVIKTWPHQDDTICREVDSILHGHASLTSLPPVCGWSDGQPLLRWPVLAKTRQIAEDTVRRGAEMNMGITRMYGRVLAELDDMPSLSVCGSLDNAKDFAARLFTLPVHSGVTGADIQALRRLVST